MGEGGRGRRHLCVSMDELVEPKQHRERGMEITMGRANLSVSHSHCLSVGASSSDRVLPYGGIRRGDGGGGRELWGV